MSDTLFKKDTSEAVTLARIDSELRSLARFDGHPDLTPFEAAQLELQQRVLTRQRKTLVSQLAHAAS